MPVELVLGGEMPEVKLGEPAAVIVSGAKKKEAFSLWILLRGRLRQSLQERTVI